MPGQSAWRFFILLLTVTSLLFAYLVHAIATPLFLAATLTGVLWPVHKRWTKRLGGRRGISAATFVIAIIVIVVGPSVAFSTFAISEGSKGAAFVAKMARNESIADVLRRLPPSVGEPAQKLLDRLPMSDDQLTDKLKDHVASKGASAAAAVGGALSATGSFLFQATMMLIALYFLLLQGDRLVAWIDGLSPLRPGQTRELMAEFKRVSYAVVLSTIVTAGVQAIAALVGYLIARVPHPLFFTGVTFLVAFIPAVGAGSVCLAVALLVFLTGHPYAALFLVGWALLVVSLVDNLLKPILIRAGMQMNGAVVFFALIGGLAAFGGVGLLLGPLIVALLLALLQMYQRDFKSSVDRS